MSDKKISSDEVPGKFVHWLLAMGCPEEKVPGVEKISKMCRGQYYMVWRSLMEQVYARDEIRNKRMQVFCDDVRKCQKNKAFCEKGSSTVVPEQITMWQQQTELRQKCMQSKDRVTLLHRDLEHLMDKISSKMAQRNLIRQKVEDASRRVWLLRQVAADLQSKKTNLEETRAIADSLCAIDEDGDIQTKLEKCLTTFRRQHSTQDCNTTTSSICSNGDPDFESLVWSLTKCRGDLLCNQLLEKRNQLVKMLSAGEEKRDERDKVTPQQVLAHTAALHCNLALEASKNKLHLKQTKKKLLDTVSELNNYLSGEACELLVLRCERAHSEARVSALRGALEALRGGGGVFRAGGPRAREAGDVAAVDKAIESKKEELKRVMSTLPATERKLSNCRECLAAVLGACRNDAPAHSALQPLQPLQPHAHYRGLQLDLPQTSIAALREYYAERRGRTRARADLSLDFGDEDGSISENIDYSNPRFVDELRIYLKKFNLDKNRQLVLDNGEKIWLFETVNSSVQRLHEQWVSQELSCSLLCPSASPAQWLAQLSTLVISKADIEGHLKTLMNVWRVKEIDISSQKKEEDLITDKAKKCLKESLLELQKVNKALTLSDDNLQFWAANNVRKYISDSRKVDGMVYRDYERYYLEDCSGI